jgi:hypothetical protein
MDKLFKRIKLSKSISWARSGNRGLVSLRGTVEGFLLLLVVVYAPIPTYKENNANDGLRD